ncbi:methylenetetrahydrofolate reductase [Aeromonas caviae]|uniref:methylenetetrahydrofolate reductase n=1 Tax=Aeromonas caviae TaxID=648 RepID=UPI002B45F63A|nr:methylenetetrahydrofolate reductase [Aeromonas caviae]
MTHFDQPMHAEHILDGYSLEVSPKDIPALTLAAPHMVPGATVSIPYLPNQDNEVRLAAARAVRGLGFAPMLHLSARRITSFAELESFVQRAVLEAGVEHCFVIAGDPSIPAGPFVDSSSLIDTGVFERAGIKVIGVGGHPEDHPVMSTAECWEVLEHKCRNIERRGMAPLIVTQFSFESDIVLAWLKALRERGIEHPVRIGVAGPASMAVLGRYAALCGVNACASMWSKYGISIGKLFGATGPDRFVDNLTAGLTQHHGQVNLHLFTFGGIAQSVKWTEQYRARSKYSHLVNMGSSS